MIVKMKNFKTRTITVGIRAKGYRQKEKVKWEVGGKRIIRLNMYGYIIIVRQWVLCDGLTVSQALIDYFLASESGCPHILIQVSWLRVRALKNDYQWYGTLGRENTLNYLLNLSYSET